MALVSDPTVKAAILDWLDRVIIGENLCPFAAGPRRQGRVAVHISDAGEDEGFLEDTQHVLHDLVGASRRETETALLVTPRLFGDFVDYNNSLAVVEALIKASSLEGEIQLASFHPDYRFAGVPDDDPANFSNRSPYPVFHFLREVSIDEAVAGALPTQAIPERNIARLRTMTQAELRQLFPTHFNREGESNGGPD